MSTPVRVRPEPIIGRPDQVETALDTMRSRHDLVEVRSVERLADGRVKVVALVVDRSAPRSGQKRRPRRRLVIIIVVASLAAALAGWALVTALTWIAQNWPAVLGSAVLAALITILILPRAGVCVGLHCPGCRHR